MDGWLVVLYLHLLAMAFFVGGQIVLAAVLVPVERRAPDPDRMRAAARRFGIGSAVALAVLLATGIAMASHFSLWESETLRIKLTLVGVLIALTLIHMRFPRAHALQGAIFLVSLAVVWLGADLAN
jgi:putative copper export protein